MGGDEFGEAVAHFAERDNAVVLKRRLVTRGETVHVERSIAHGLSEEEKARRFSDYSRVPKYNLPADRGTTQEPSEDSQGAAVEAPGPRRSDAEEASEGPQNLGGEDGWGRRSDDRKRKAAMRQANEDGRGRGGPTWETLPLARWTRRSEGSSPG
jgi:hypothetical protein